LSPVKQAATLTAIPAAVQPTAQPASAPLNRATARETLACSSTISTFAVNASATALLTVGLHLAAPNTVDGPRALITLVSPLRSYTLIPLSLLFAYLHDHFNFHRLVIGQNIGTNS